MIKNRIEIDNVNSLFEIYKGEENILIGIDYLEDNEADLVVYDTTELLTTVYDFEEFIQVIEENGLDEEEFEIDRTTLVKI